MFGLKHLFVTFIVSSLTIASSPIAVAQSADFTLVAQSRDHSSRNGNRSNRGSNSRAYSIATLPSWMNSDVGDAWSEGYFGQGVSITVVDDFRSRYGYYGDLGSGTNLMRHGSWVYGQAVMTAPAATMRAQDFTSGRAVQLDRRQMNVLNLSYGMYAQAGYTSVNWGQQEASIIKYANNGSALIVKAAGNDAIAVGEANTNGQVDYLNADLIGAQSSIFVGALNAHGTIDAPTELAPYSNYAGTNPDVQHQFLTVGVRGDETRLYGTSFAAPIVSGYAAVIGSKFPSASATQIATQLLDTARTDTIRDYDVAIHGQGEASLSRALAPQSIQ